MAKSSGLKKAVKMFKDADDLCQIVTGKKLAQLGANIIAAYGEDIGGAIDKALNTQEEELPADSPYRVLHCRPDADDIVIRGKYRLLVKELHPDTGAHPDVKEFQRVVEAYNQIRKERDNPDR
jgi:hypothetical protein